MPPGPTTTEWIAAAVAAALVVVVGGRLLVTPALRRGTRHTSARLAGMLLGCTAVALLLVVAVLVGTGLRSSMISTADLEAGTDLPAGAFVRLLFNPSLDVTERTAWYAAGLLVPASLPFGVLAVAVVDRQRSVGLRVVAAVLSFAFGAFAAYVALGDTSPLPTDPGPLAARAATGFVVLAVATLLALAVDHVRHGGGPATPTA